MASHYVVIAWWGDQCQAVCNVYICGWAGTLTSDKKLAELEKEQHMRWVEAMGQS